MREWIATGKNVDEATETACRELGKTRDEVSVEILEMPSRKFFKNIPAKVRVTVIEEKEEAAASPAEEKKQARPEPHKEKQKESAPKEVKAAAEQQRVLEQEPEEPIDLSENQAAKRAVEYLSSIFTAAGAENIGITAVRQGDSTLVRVNGDNLADVMEVRGEAIQALSYLTDRAVNKGVDKKEAEYLRVRLDVAGYRNRREGELISLAQKVGAEVIRTKRSQTLAPMNSYERLIVHTSISRMEGLKSESIGADVERRVVIKSTAPDATDGEDWKQPRRDASSGRNRGGRSRENNNRGRGQRGERDRGRGSDRRNEGPRPPRSSAPEREYADQPRETNAAPKVPERREAIRDGEDMPLYGKIEL